MRIAPYAHFDNMPDPVTFLKFIYVEEQKILYASCITVSLHPPSTKKILYATLHVLNKDHNIQAGPRAYRLLKEKRACN